MDRRLSLRQSTLSIGHEARPIPELNSVLQIGLWNDQDLARCWLTFPVSGYWGIGIEAAKWVSFLSFFELSRSCCIRDFILRECWTSCIVCSVIGSASNCSGPDTVPRTGLCPMHSPSTPARGYGQYSIGSSISNGRGFINCSRSNATIPESVSVMTGISPQCRVVMFRFVAPGGILQYQETIPSLFKIKQLRLSVLLPWIHFFISFIIFLPLFLKSQVSGSLLG